MSVDFKRYLDVTSDNLAIYLFDKKIMNKNLSAKSNIILLNIITAMINYKTPRLLINRFDKYLFKSCFVHLIDNDICTILPSHLNRKCNSCKKNQATYEHVTKNNYYLANKPFICDVCLQSCVDFSNYSIMALSMPNIFNLYCLYKKIDIYANLIHEIKYTIFYMIIQ